MKPFTRIRKAVPTEKQDHIALVQWMSLHPLIKDIFFHVPNGGMRNRRTYTTKSGKTYTYSPEGVQMKRMGVRAGVSDFFIALPISTTTKTYHGLWIELKPRLGGTISFEQKKWLDAMSHLGYKSVVCHGFDEAVQEIDAYILDGSYSKGFGDASNGN